MRAETICFNDVTQRPMEWLWHGWIGVGHITTFDGDPSLGKSTVLLDLAARVSTNGVMPNGYEGPTGGVLILSSEDAYDEVILPRLEAAGADISQVHFLPKVSDGNTWHLPTIPGDLPAIEESCFKHRIKLLIIDPFVAFLSGHDAMKDQDVRHALYALQDMSIRTRVATVVVRHMTKVSGGRAMYRGGGSIGIIGAARSGIIVGKDQDNDEHRVIASAKANYAKPPQAMKYTLIPNGNGMCHVQWLGTSALTADELLIEPDPEDTSLRDFATEFLQTQLANGPKDSTEIKREAKTEGISPKMLRKVRQELCNKPFHDGHTGQWLWSLKCQDAKTTGGQVA